MSSIYCVPPHIVTGEKDQDVNELHSPILVPHKKHVPHGTEMQLKSWPFYHLNVEHTDNESSRHTETA